jgi:glycosyltransferase involved in cell wall biosynthesis
MTMRRLTIVIPTFNRASSLERTLHSVVASAFRRKDVIVVDNNSTDQTPAVVARFGPEIRYLKEPQQGLSHARNTGIEAARALGAELVAFIDDDVEAADGWAESVVAAFDAHPEADCIGGRVLPSNAEELPAWITPERWGPLALQDHGPWPLVFDASFPYGLIGANFAFRLRTFDRVGMFSPAVQRVKDGIGSTEDHEMLNRLYTSGGRAAYVPDVVVSTEVPAERMTFDYHRRWHRGHGQFTARMRIPEVEATSRGRMLGVPGHMFRGAAADAGKWMRSIATRDTHRAFDAETRLWFFSGFLKERCACALRR